MQIRTAGAVLAALALTLGGPAAGALATEGTESSQESIAPEYRPTSPSTDPSSGAADADEHGTTTESGPASPGEESPADPKPSTEPSPPSEPGQPTPEEPEGTGPNPDSTPTDNPGETTDEEGEIGDPVAVVTYKWFMPKSPADGPLPTSPTWDQVTFVDDGSQIGYCQVDVYDVSTSEHQAKYETIISDDVLTEGEDSEIYVSAVFEKCGSPVTPPVVTPPTDTTPPPVVTPPAPPVPATIVPVVQARSVQPAYEADVLASTGGTQLEQAGPWVFGAGIVSMLSILLIAWSYRNRAKPTDEEVS